MSMLTDLELALLFIPILLCLLAFSVWLQWRVWVWMEKHFATQRVADRLKE